MVVREPWSASNPFLTHGPVESPSQLPLHSLPALSRGAWPSPINPKGSKNVTYLLGARSFLVKPLEKEEFLLSVCRLKGIVIEGENDTRMWETLKPSISG
jgi:hypothetical protein